MLAKFWVTSNCGFLWEGGGGGVNNNNEKAKRTENVWSTANKMFDHKWWERGEVHKNKKNQII